MNSWDLPSAPEPMHRWSGAGGIGLAGDSWGDPDGPLVILQHGGGQTRHAWKGVGRLLAADGYHAVAFDARGHGDSDWAPDGAYGQDVMVKDLLLVAEALGKQHPVLVGASMGAGTSLIAVGENRIDATAIVLVDMAPRIDPQGAERIHAFMDQRPEGFASLEEVADAIASYQPHRKRQRNLHGLAKNVRLRADGRYHWHWDPKFRSGALRLELRQARLEACARRLSLPTLLVRGALSDVLSEAGAREFLELCPRAEYVNVAGAGHMVAGDRNDVFADAVIDFLAAHVPVAPKPRQNPRHRRARRDDVVDLP